MDEKSHDFDRQIVRTISYLERSRRRYINDNLRDSGMRGSMFLAILYLNRHPGSSQDMVAAELLHDKGNIARMCRRLEELGYIYRDQSETDRRQNQLYLTESGKVQLAHIKELLGQWRCTAMSGMSDEETGELIRLLTHMMDNVIDM